MALKSWVGIAIAGFSSVSLLSGCVYSGSSSYEEHYVSPQVQGQSSRINLDAVEKAFFETKGSDLNSWMSAFEKRVNEIYEGTEIVSIDATRKTGKLQITGFVEKNNQPGFQSGEDKLFSIEQTGDVVGNNLPYRVTDQRGSTYHEGHYSLLDNPFIQALIIGHMFSAFGPRYYTPLAHTVVLRDYRNSFRASPQFQNQRIANNGFNSRFKQRAFDSGLRSRNSFGRGTGYGGYGRGSGTGMPQRSWRTSPFGGGYGRGFGGRGFSRGFGRRF